jgi:NADP-dependent 3-hydroxy acid dehydrogenase YdfG
MDLQFAGKVGIVTGASRGIRCAIARTLSDHGMPPALVACSRDRFEELSAWLSSENLVRAADLRAPAAPAVASLRQCFSLVILHPEDHGTSVRLFS